MTTNGDYENELAGHSTYGHPYPPFEVTTDTLRYLGRAAEQLHAFACGKADAAHVDRLGKGTEEADGTASRLSSSSTACGIKQDEAGVGSKAALSLLNALRGELPMILEPL